LAGAQQRRLHRFCATYRREIERGLELLLESRRSGRGRAQVLLSRWTEFEEGDLHRVTYS
jgi:hypothetical protein